MEWSKLSMPERAEYIRLGVLNGVTSLDAIRETYNSYAGGGDLESSSKRKKPMSDFDWWLFNQKQGIKRAFNNTKKTVSEGIKSVQDAINLVTHPKDDAYAIMVGRRGNTFGTSRYKEDIKDALEHRKEIVSDRSNIPRNLSSLYIYGNDLNQFEETPELTKVGVNYDNYLKSIGKNPNNIKTYKGDIPISVTLPNTIEELLPDYIRSNKNKTYGNAQDNYGGIKMDNVAGFLQRLSLDSNRNPIVVNSDLWDFEPNSYSKKYNDDSKSYIKAKALDIIGTPFILKDTSKVNFVDITDFYDRYDVLSDLEKNVARDFGFLPEVVVTTSKQK